MMSWTRFLAVGALAAFAGLASAEEDESKDVKVPVSLAEVRAFPEAFRRVPFDLALLFHGPRDVYNPFYTVFEPSSYLNFAAWTADAPVFTRDGFCDDYPFFYVDRKNMPLQRQVVAMRPLTWFNARCVVRDVAQNKAWIEVLSITEVGPLMDSTDLRHLVRANVLSGNGEFERALLEFDMARLLGAPPKFIARCRGEEGRVALAANQPERAAMALEQAFQWFPEDSQVATLLDRASTQIVAQREGRSIVNTERPAPPRKSEPKAAPKRTTPAPTPAPAPVEKPVEKPKPQKQPKPQKPAEPAPVEPTDETPEEVTTDASDETTTEESTSDETATDETPGDEKAVEDEGTSTDEADPAADGSADDEPVDATEDEEVAGDESEDPSDDEATDDEAVEDESADGSEPVDGEESGETEEVDASDETTDEEAGIEEETGDVDGEEVEGEPVEVDESTDESTDETDGTETEEVTDESTDEGTESGDETDGEESGDEETPTDDGEGYDESDGEEEETGPVDDPETEVDESAPTDDSTDDETTPPDDPGDER